MNIFYSNNQIKLLLRLLVCTTIGLMNISCDAQVNDESSNAKEQVTINESNEKNKNHSTIIEKTGPDNRKKGKTTDTYACAINSLGHCIFTGAPHQTGLQPGTDNIIDREGTILFFANEAIASNATGERLKPSGRPAFDGDQIIQSIEQNISNDEKAFHRTMAIMFPVRNALMYDIEKTTQNDWNLLVAELALRDIKNFTYIDGPTPRDNYYSRQGIFDLAKQPDRRDIHHDIMKFLEESGLYLLCHVTSDEFNEQLQASHPEGHNPCQDANIVTKIGY